MKNEKKHISKDNPILDDKELVFKDNPFFNENLSSTISNIEIKYEFKRKESNLLKR